MMGFEPLICLLLKLALHILHQIRDFGHALEQEWVEIYAHYIPIILGCRDKNMNFEDSLSCLVSVRATPL